MASGIAYLAGVHVLQDASASSSLLLSLCQLFKIKKKKLR